MKRLGLLALVTATLYGQVGGVKSVYILPMGGGLDQYLANWLTREHALQVVADPQVADAVLTDSLGETFEQRMLKIRPRESDKDDEKSSDTHPVFQSGRSRGTIFLVDAKSRQVLWSDYEKAPRTRSAASLNRMAERIVKKLRAPAPK